jgi:hypothetical protein
MVKVRGTADDRISTVLEFNVLLWLHLPYSPSTYLTIPTSHHIPDRSRAVIVMGMVSISVCEEYESVEVWKDKA